MEELKKEINNQIEILKELIKQEKDEEVKKQRKVVDKLLNQYLKEQLKNINQIKINSNEKAIPHILNISVMGIKPETMQHALEEYDIYISTQSACSSNNPISRSVLEATKDEETAKHSIRISLSGITTKEEIDQLVSALKNPNIKAEII